MRLYFKGILDGEQYSLTEFAKSSRFNKIVDDPTLSDTNLIIPSEYCDYPVTQIDYNALKGCHSLISVIIPESVTRICGWAFDDCTSLKSINIPSNVEFIGEGVFSGCDSLADVYYNGTAEQFYKLTRDASIPPNATIHCVDGIMKMDEMRQYFTIHANRTPSEGLKYTLNEDGVSYSVTGIGSCNDVNFVIPSTYEGKPVTGIGEKALVCGKMASITIPDSITSVGEHAFFLCESLKKVTVGKGVTSWGMGALFHCVSLESITVDENNPTYHSASNCLIETATKTLIQGCRTGNIPNDGSITQIGAYAFADYSSLENAVIPDGVTVVDAGAYSDCKSLKSITIPASVEDVRFRAFDTATEIHLKGGADEFYRATRYADIAPDTTIYLEIEGIEKSIKMGKLEEMYKIMRGYSDGLDYTLNPDEQSLTLTGKGFCRDKDIVIPSKIYGKPVTEIGWGAFAWKNHITSITIPNSVTSIGGDAFYNCTSLTDIHYQGTASDFYNLIRGQRLPLDTQLHFAGGAACTVGELEEHFDRTENAK